MFTSSGWTPSRSILDHLADITYDVAEKLMEAMKARLMAAHCVGLADTHFKQIMPKVVHDERVDLRDSWTANTAIGWKNSNLRTEMTRLLRRAGVSGWPRLFHSMRASRQTELQREFPLHVVCSWLGNSPRIAQQSYLLVTEDDFAKGAGVAKVMVE